jgi:hypothetical protein
MSLGLATTYRYRRATKDDRSAIFVLLEKVAPEIPLLLDSLEQKNAAGKIVGSCCDSGETWVALDRENNITGFLLAEHYGEGLHLPYAGVTKSHRGQEIFPTLMGKMKANGVPLRTSIAHSKPERSKIINFLLKRGFICLGPSGTEDQFDWDPGRGSP